MNYFFINFIICILFLTYGAVKDLKYRNVPNYFSYLFISYAFLFIALTKSDFNLIIILSVMLPLLVGFYYHKVGGADIKFMFAMVLIFQADILFILSFSIFSMIFIKSYGLMKGSDNPFIFYLLNGFIYYIVLTLIPGGFILR